MFPKPLVIAVNGVGVGMGTTLRGYADLAFAAESARFRTPFTAMGISPELGSSWLLPHLIGWQRVSWMHLSSEWVDARKAAAWGLVFEVVRRGAPAARDCRGPCDRDAQSALGSRGEAHNARMAHRRCGAGLAAEKTEFGPLFRTRTAWPDRCG